jgi:hypothetical protein
VITTNLWFKYIKKDKMPNLTSRTLASGASKTDLIHNAILSKT